MDDDKMGIVSVYNIFLDGVNVLFRYADIGRMGDDWTTISVNNNEQNIGISVQPGTHTCCNLTKAIAGYCIL
jgi:hypothetical protein